MRSTFLEEAEAKQILADFVLGARQLSMGEKCKAFEAAFAVKQGRKYAVLFNSGGSANLAMLQALKNLGRLKVGDKIGFSALTWSTNVMPILQMGFQAVPIDCDPRTLNSMSRTAIKSLVAEGCKCFFLTNVLGLTGDLATLEKKCEKEGILVLEDNCESLGTELPEGKAGNFSEASSFSFFVGHHMSTIEGGMVTTDDHDLAEMLHMVRANGWDRNIHPERKKHWREKHAIESDFHANYTFYDLGFNLRPTEITGILGLHQLTHLDKSIDVRERNFKKIQKAIAKNPDFLPLDSSHIKKLSAFALSFVCKTPALRHAYLKRFEEAGIEVRPLIAGNMQRQPFYKKHISHHFELPGADILHHNGFYCGNCPDYTKEELDIILECLKKPKK